MHHQPDTYFAKIQVEDMREASWWEELHCKGWGGGEGKELDFMGAASLGKAKGTREKAEQGEEVEEEQREVVIC